MKGYLVHAVNVPGELRIREPVTREALVEYPRPLRRRELHLEVGGLRVWVTELGAIIAIQHVSEGPAREELWNTYTEDDAFERHYAYAVNAVAKAVRCMSEDFDFSFALLVGSDDAWVDWSGLEIPADHSSFEVLLDAVSIHQAAEKLSSLMREIPRARRDPAVQRDLIEYGESVFGLARPNEFLISKDEISLMERFYDSWRISDRILSLERRFGFAVNSYSFAWDYREKRGQALGSFLLGGIALASLLQAAGPIARVLEVRQDLVEVALLGATILVIAIGVLRFFGPDLYFRARGWLGRSKLQAQVQPRLEKP